MRRVLGAVLDEEILWVGGAVLLLLAGLGVPGALGVLQLVASVVLSAFAVGIAAAALVGLPYLLLTKRGREDLFDGPRPTPPELL